MGRRSAIEWLADDAGEEGASWNWIRGCSRVMAAGATQSGCGDQTGGGCYAERDGGRFCGDGQPYHGLVRLTATGPRWTGQVHVIGKHLCDPLRWRDPMSIFVASVADPFHDKLSNEVIAGAFGVMALAKQHTFISLTKRAQRMRRWFQWAAGITMTDLIDFALTLVRQYSPTAAADERAIARAAERQGPYTWPLPNLWLGTSTEHQAAFDERWPELEQCPAAVRVLSIEPLIGKVNIFAATASGKLGWAIIGAESGNRPRPCDPNWIELVIDQCKYAGVPVFLKQAVGCCDPSAPDKGCRNHIHPGPGSKRKRGGLIGTPLWNGVQLKEHPAR